MTTTREAKLDVLSAEYTAYLEANDLEKVSAEVLIHETLTDEQRAWVTDFITRWDAADVEDREVVLATRTFWHGNLQLRLIHNEYMGLYRIEIYRENDRSKHDLWGVWMHGDGSDLPAARAKFESIQL